MCELLKEIDLKMPYTRIDPLRATGLLAEEIIYDRLAGGGGTLEIDPATYVFDKDTIRLEVKHEDLWPWTLHVTLFAYGNVQTGEAAWKKGAQGFIVTSRRRCRSYGIDPDNLEAIEARLKAEVDVYYTYLNQHETHETQEKMVS